MHVRKYQSYLSEKHSKLFESWSAIIKINTEGKYLIMKWCPVYTDIYILIYKYYRSEVSLTKKMVLIVNCS